MRRSGPGHPGTRGQIAADLYLGMLNGEFYGLNEDEIIGRVLAKRRPEDNPQPDATDTADDGTAGGGRGAAAEDIGTADGDAIDGDAADGDPEDDSDADDSDDDSDDDESEADVSEADDSEHVGADHGGESGDGAGRDDWHPLLHEIAHAWEQRDELRRRLAANPSARCARGSLADHVCVRDRNCVGPGCMCPARRSDLDHTRDHGRGGPTTEDNIGPACRRHHPDKDRGWSLSQPEPGLFRWVSPLGRVYWSRGEPVRPDVPDPDPAPDGYEETAAEVDQRLRRYDPRMLERPGTEPPRPPPPRPEPPPDHEPPPF